MKAVLSAILVLMLLRLLGVIESWVVVFMPLWIYAVIVPVVVFLATRLNRH